MIGKFFDRVSEPCGDNPGGLDTYCIRAVGVTDERGTFVDAVSTTRFRKQRNGVVPAGVGVFIDPAIVRDDVAA